MQHKQRSLDGTQHKTRVPKPSYPRKARVAKRQITPKQGATMKRRSGMQAAVVTKPTPGFIKSKGTEKIFVRIDLHKKFL